jgi:hypothetical protein
MAEVETPKEAESAVVPSVPRRPAITQNDVIDAYTNGWNCALDAVLIQLHQRDERGPAGERAGLQDILGAVRVLKK